MSTKFNVFPLDDSPGFIIHLMDTQMKAALQRAFQSKGFDLTPEQWGLLNRLWETEGIHQSILAGRTGKDRHNITRILNLLEKKGLTKRVPDPDDRRRYKIYLTEPGRELERKLPPIVTDLLQKCFKGLTQKELQDLERVHKHILKNLGQLQEE
ncbi:MAG: MarR family transcriptional regulator [Desulfobacteraceae bacterium]|jgi:DNA-binding MarR family transcriptional regulator